LKLQTNSYNKQIAIQLDLKGNIQKVILNTYQDIVLHEGDSIVHLFSNESLQTFFENFSNTLNNQFSLGTRVLLTNHREVFMFMMKNPQTVTLFTISLQEEIVSLFDEIVKFNNEQIKAVRELYKKLSKNTESRGFFEEILLVNNALTNSRREASMQKRHIELMERELEELTFKDSLTQLANRSKFFYDIYRLVLQKEYKLTRLNIINFDVVNEEFGHQKGDELLCDIARELGDLATITNGFAYRMCGDEFILLTPALSEINSLDLYEKCLAVLKNYHKSISVAYGDVIINQTNCNDTNRIESILKEANNQIVRMKKKYHETTMYDRRSA